MLSLININKGHNTFIFYYEKLFFLNEPMLYFVVSYIKNKVIICFLKKKYKNIIFFVQK